MMTAALLLYAVISVLHCLRPSLSSSVKYATCAVPLVGGFVCILLLSCAERRLKDTKEG